MRSSAKVMRPSWLCEEWGRPRTVPAPVSPVAALRRRSCCSLSVGTGRNRGSADGIQMDTYNGVTDIARQGTGKIQQADCP